MKEYVICTINVSNVLEKNWPTTQWSTKNFEDVSLKERLLGSMMEKCWPVSPPRFGSSKCRMFLFSGRQVSHSAAPKWKNDTVLSHFQPISSTEDIVSINSYIAYLCLKLFNLVDNMFFFIYISTSEFQDTQIANWLGLMLLVASIAQLSQWQLFHFGNVFRRDVAAQNGQERKTKVTWTGRNFFRGETAGDSQLETAADVRSLRFLRSHCHSHRCLRWFSIKLRNVS